MSYVVTPPFRVLYPNLLSPAKNKLSNIDEYSVIALFKKDEDLSLLKEAIDFAIVNEWGNGKEKIPSNLRIPLKTKYENGNTPVGLEQGAFFATLKARLGFPPVVVRGDLTPLVNPAELYSGCWCVARVKAYAYNPHVNKGVGLSLISIQKIKDDEPISPFGKVEDYFTPVRVATAQSRESIKYDLF